MSSTMSTPERSRSIPPPPPPIGEKEKEDDLSVEYGSMANTYSNNHMADDESVEAQHVVYTFAEESSKSSKKGRKKCIWLMLASLVLFSAVVALGVVYGTQRKNRNKGTIAEANSAEINQATSDQEDDSSSGNAAADAKLDEDVYDTPNFADSNSTEFEDEEETLDDEEDLSDGSEIIVGGDADSSNTTTITPPTIPDAGTPAPTIIPTGTVTTGTTWSTTSGTSSTGTLGGGRFQGQGGFQGGQGNFQGGQGNFQGGQGGQGNFQGGQGGQGNFQGGQGGQGNFQGGQGGQGNFQGGQGGQGQNQQRPNQGGFQGGQAGQGGNQGGQAGQSGFQQRPNQAGFQQGVGNNGQIGRESDNVFGV